jgi:hypothetical protein
MIDFSATALRAGMDAFARAVTVQPVRSQPGAPAYLARGVFAAPHLQIDGIAIEAGVSSASPTLGIRLSEFPEPPGQGDRIVIGPATWEVADVTPDGEGGATLVLTEA